MKSELPEPTPPASMLTLSPAASLAAYRVELTLESPINITPALPEAALITTASTSSVVELIC